MRVALMICAILIGSALLVTLRWLDPSCRDVTIGQVIEMAACR